MFQCINTAKTTEERLMFFEVVPGFCLAEGWRVRSFFCDDFFVIKGLFGALLVAFDDWRKRVWGLVSLICIMNERV